MRVVKWSWRPVVRLLVLVSVLVDGWLLAAPEIEVSPLDLDFGSVVVGDSKALVTTLRNVGTEELTVSGVGFGEGSSQAFAVVAASPTVLLPGASVAAIATYTPASATRKTATLEIESDDADESLVLVSLSGVGIVFPTGGIEVSLERLDFGAVAIGAAGIRTVTLTNSGGGTLEVRRVGFSEGTSSRFVITRGSGPAVLDAGAGEDIDVTFTPGGLDIETGALEIETNDDLRPLIIVPLSATGVEASSRALIDVFPLLLEYGDVRIGSVATLLVTLRNLGDAALEVHRVALAAGSSNSFRIGEGAGGVLLAPSETRTIEVQFLPTGLSPKTGVLEIDSNAANVSRVIVEVFGTAFRAEPVEFSFLRGDCDADGVCCSGVNDALVLLGWLFLGSSRPGCLSACDLDGNGGAELTDAVYGLNFCFAGRAPPVAPFPDCGPGTDADLAVGCETSANCE